MEIPPEVVDSVAAGHGQLISRISKIDPRVLAQDMLSPEKSVKRYEILSRYVDPQGKRILEVGCGYGTNLIVWVKNYGLDVTGVEPEGEGFAETVAVSSRLMEVNGVPADRIKVSTGEELPFADASFDIVYSANVLEHTNDPVKVLRECLRVLRPGGTLHFEIPNYLSFFEGHYYVFMPPIWWRGLLPFWVKWVCGRDPAFAKTFRTEINPIWLRRTMGELKKEYPLQLVSLGEELFRERLSRASFKFDHEASQSKLRPLINILLALNRGNLVSNSIILLQAHYPLFLTVRKENGSR